MSIGKMKFIYSVTFDRNANGWSKDQECNRYFLTYIQCYANNVLKSRGHIFLNDVYDMLGLPRTEEGYIYGWLYRPGDTTRNNFVDFGISDQFIETDKLNYELRFNVDGNISNLI